MKHNERLCMSSGLGPSHDCPAGAGIVSGKRYLWTTVFKLLPHETGGGNVKKKIISIPNRSLAKIVSIGSLVHGCNLL